MIRHPRTIPYGLFMTLLVMDVVVLLIEKRAALHAMGTYDAFYVRLIHQPWLWISLALGPLQLWTWTSILARTELSLAYPLSSLSYPLTMLAAQIVYGERLSVQMWLGALLITVGVARLSGTVDHRSTGPDVVGLPSAGRKERVG